MIRAVGLAHPRPEGGRQADRPGADHREVADLVVAHDQGPGRGERLAVECGERSGTDAAMQVKTGVSRRV